MNFKDLQKELQKMDGVSNQSLIRQNVIKVDLDKSVSKAFLLNLKKNIFLSIAL